jgi:N utilization substance protein A
VREAGDRAKVAVYSRERDVDPVGACVGMKGTRVQAIIRELRGEKIDIVEWSEDPVLFVTNAISPARVQRVTIVDDAERVMEVVVEDKQLSLAIGKKGQNVRLAAKLTGWKIDIKSEEEKRREVEAQFMELSMPSVEEGPAGEGPGEALPAEAVQVEEGAVEESRAEAEGDDTQEAFAEVTAGGPDSVSDASTTSEGEEAAAATPAETERS